MTEIKHFIHIPKNGGMTIRHSPMLKNRMIVSSANTHKSAEYTSSLLLKMKETGDHPGIEHARWRDINPAITEKYQSFAMIRNPWDRFVSNYEFDIRNEGVTLNNSNKYEDKKNISFTSYLNYFINLYYQNGYGYWLKTPNNKMDYVCKLESLDVDFAYVCGRLNIPNIKIPHINNFTEKFKRNKYQDYYDNNSKDLVYKYFKEDINKYNYEF